VFVCSISTEILKRSPNVNPSEIRNIVEKEWRMLTED